MQQNATREEPMDVKPPFVRSPYNYNMNEASDASGLKCQDKTLAQQHMADECDINKLVERFVVTGELPQRSLPPLQGDFTNIPTYQEALNLMIEANQSFMQLPANVRNRFENDPGQFVAFVSDEANRDEMRRMGLWSKEAVQAFEEKAAAEKARIASLEADSQRLQALEKQKGDTGKGVT